MHTPRPKAFLEKIADSQYFLIAGSLHLVLFAMIGSIVVFHAIKSTTKEPKTEFIVGDPVPPDPPEVQVPVPIQDDTTSQASNSGPSTSALNDTPSSKLTTFAVEGGASGPVIYETKTFGNEIRLGGGPTTSSNPGPGNTPVGNGINPGRVGKSDNFDLRAPQIRETLKIWSKKGDGRIGTGPGDLSAKFVIHIAKYAEGDWHATLDIAPDGTIIRGSIPNLLRLTKEWTKGRVDSEVVPRPLDIAGPELMEKLPPFVFFHGHKDFELTDAEVENLRRYLMAGGAIWADSCLAGKGSRFDIAFRREMKKVIPDEDKTFVPLPLSHDLFGGRMAFFQLGEVPAGMNYYSEPIEVVNIDGLTAIIYTSNDYSDMMRIPFRPGTRTVDTRQGPGRIAVLPWNMWHNRATLYRNFEAPTAEKSYQLGLNIIAHLLLRFNDRLKTALP